MTNEQIENEVQNIIKEIQNQSFTGTEEEIKIQQILYFDKYVKENIEYGFDAVNFSINYPNEQNPFDSAYKLEGFFEHNKINGKRLAVCGSISQVANKIFNKLGISCDYVWGHFNIGTESNPQYVGHRWNVVTIGDKNYMVDFTLGMIVHNINKDDNYSNGAYNLLGITDKDSEYDYLFFDKLAPTLSLGGFKKNEKGSTVDDINESGYLNNCTTNPNEVIPNLGYISPMYASEYARQFDTSKIL